MSTVAKPPREDATPEAAEEKAEAAQMSDHQIVQILQEGRVSARIRAILAKLPPDRHGFLCRNTVEDIEAFIALGYRVETGLSGGVHGAGDGRVIIGDVILMTTSQDNIAAIRRAEAYLVRKKLDIAQNQYMGDSTNEGRGMIVPFNESERRT